MLTENTLFPGRPNYVGPTAGMFGLLHHEVLCESSHNVMERVAYVRDHKLKNEITIRLHNMIYLGGCPEAAERATLYADYATTKCYATKWWATLYAYAAKCDLLDAPIMAYIRSHIPDCAWNGTTLVFPWNAAASSRRNTAVNHRPRPDRAHQLSMIGNRPLKRMSTDPQIRAALHKQKLKRLHARPAIYGEPPSLATQQKLKAGRRRRSATILFTAVVDAASETQKSAPAEAGTGTNYS